jgi:signal transduction histidine kinase
MSVLSADYSCSVLVVEDNAGDQLLIADYLEEMIRGVEIRLADSFKDSRKILEEQDPDAFDVILLDLSLPDHSGEELIRDMVLLSHGVPIVVLTGNTDIQFSLRSLSLGISDYLLKDEISPNSLFKSVLYAIERKRYGTLLKDFENNMNRAVIQAQETERYEIGTELHDNVGQILVTSQLHLGLLEDVIPENLHGPYDKSIELIGQALREIRGLSHRLAPPLFADSTISETFGILLRTFNVDQRYAIALEIPDSLPLLTEAAHLNLYRILQEQLRNIARHSQATEIRVNLELTSGGLNFRISDNGIGFDMESAAYGIGFANIRRRVELFSGTFALQAAPGKGCALDILLPLAEITGA